MEKEKKEKVTRLDYCQYLLVSQTNYTLTNFAEHCERAMIRLTVIWRVIRLGLILYGKT